VGITLGVDHEDRAIKIGSRDEDKCLHGRGACEQVPI
jgi:hypothetical protein